MIAFIVSDMTDADSAGSVIKALRAVDDDALVQIDLAKLKVRISPSTASRAEFSDAIRHAGYTPSVLLETRDE